MILIYRFSETIPIAIGKFLAATSSPLYPQLPNSPKLQLPSAALSIPSSPKLQLPSAALSIPSSPAPQLPSSPLYPQLPNSPAALSIPISPAPQLPKSQVREAVEALVPLVPAGCTSSLVPTLLYCPTGRVNRVSVVPHTTGLLIDPVAAVLLKPIGCSSALRRLKLICSSAPERSQPVR